jgi:hypothetical protein
MILGCTQESVLTDQVGMLLEDQGEILSGKRVRVSRFDLLQKGLAKIVYYLFHILRTDE